MITIAKRPELASSKIQRHDSVSGERINRLVSPYYPPRARWYSRLLQAGHALRRRLWLDRIHLSDAVTAGNFIGGLLVPGYAFYARGERLIGRAVLLVCVLLAATFFIWLGHPIASVAFGLLLSAHVTSVLFLLGPWLANVRFGFRMAYSLMVVALVGGCLYTPVRNQIQKHFVMPLRIRERVVVVQTGSSSKAVWRGDWIAYALSREGGNESYVRGGLSLGPVLAVAGDRVRFTPGGFEVNGVRHPLLPHMPTSGEMIVAEKHWFVWPDFAMRGHGNMMNASATMLQLASVPETRFVGKPFKRWFWRRQLLP